MPHQRHASDTGDQTIDPTQAYVTTDLGVKVELAPSGCRGALTVNYLDVQSRRELESLMLIVCQEQAVRLAISSSHRLDRCPTAATSLP
jgi:hypothetical protein